MFTHCRCCLAHWPSSLSDPHASVHQVLLVATVAGVDLPAEMSEYACTLAEMIEREELEEQMLEENPFGAMADLDDD